MQVREGDSTQTFNDALTRSLSSPEKANCDPKWKADTCEPGPVGQEEICSHAATLVPDSATERPRKTKAAFYHKKERKLFRRTHRLLRRQRQHERLLQLPSDDHPVLRRSLSRPEPAAGPAAERQVLLPAQPGRSPPTAVRCLPVSLRGQSAPGLRRRGTRHVGLRRGSSEK